MSATQRILTRNPDEDDNDGDSEEDDNNENRGHARESRAVLPVSDQPLNPNAPPATGEEYLQMVRCVRSYSKF